MRIVGWVLDRGCHLRVVAWMTGIESACRGPRRGDSIAHAVSTVATDSGSLSEPAAGCGTISREITDGCQCSCANAAAGNAGCSSHEQPGTRFTVLITISHPQENACEEKRREKLRIDALSDELTHCDVRIAAGSLVGDFVLHAGGASRACHTDAPR